MPCRPEVGSGFIRIKPAACWFRDQDDPFGTLQKMHSENSFKVPYSMHSSVSELQQLVRELKPRTIFPMTFRPIRENASHYGFLQWSLREILDQFRDCLVPEAVEEIIRVSQSQSPEKPEAFDDLFKAIVYGESPVKVRLSTPQSPLKSPSKEKEKKDRFEGLNQEAMEQLKQALAAGRPLPYLSIT